MDKQKVLAKLMWDLQSFLSVLDSENLSYIAQAQKKSISELLSRLQSQDAPVEDAEYMIMSCPSSSPSNELADTPTGEGIQSSELVSKQDLSVWLRNGSQGPAVPPHPPGGLGDEDDDDDEDTYEEAEPFISDTIANTEKAESDSSHYESYGEEEEDEEEGEELVKDRAHYIQLTASQPCLRPAPESRLCGYLWRKKWLGQWTKQLFVIRSNILLCYKCARDLLPRLQLDLRGCRLVYKTKTNRKIQHQIKLVLLGSDTLVLGSTCYQQAEEWRKVIEEVSVGGELETQRSSSLVRSDRPLSCRSSSVLQTDSEEEKPAAEPKDKGFLNVLMNCQWQNLLCQVEVGLLKMFGEEEGEEEEEDEEDTKRQRPPQYTVQLRGCEVKPGPDTDHAYRITLSQHGDQVAVLEASCSDDKERWLQLLRGGAANQNHHDNNSTQDHIGGALSGLKTRQFPTSNMYMDDPFHLSGTVQAQPIYSNTSILEHMFQSSHDAVQSDSVSKDSVTYSNTVFTSHNRKAGEAERGVQKLELTGNRREQLRAGSEVNLASVGKQNKRTSFRQSLAFCSERAQAGFLNPLLRRTASAKTSLRKAPSAMFIEHGNVFQRRKEWETKAAA